MAINKDLDTEYGVQFTYHKIREVRIINDENGVQLTITVNSWINKQARIEGKRPCIRQCIIQGADFAMNPFYALLKAKFTDFTAGADDFNNDFKKENIKPVELTEQTTDGKLLSRKVEK